MATTSDPPNHRGATPPLVGGWRLLSRLGAGSFGTAWRAEDASGRVAVVKLLHDVPGDEVRALSRVSHPAVVRLLDAGAVPVPYLCMSLAPGRPLSDWFDRGGLTDGQQHRLVCTLASALAACHHAGVVHRDVKPENVLFAPESDRVTLIDFGLAGGEGGTPRYAAPEVLAGEAGGPAADVYALGLVAWEASAGALPHHDREWVEAIDLRSRAAPEPQRGPGWWRDLVTSMLHPEPGVRPTAAAVADVFAVNGVAAPSPTVADLELRADTVHVPVVGLAEAVQGWRATPGSLAVIGPDGSGRSHAVGTVANELRALGLAFVALRPTGRPWAAVEMALADPSLRGASASLPDGADMISRARAAAQVLLQRANGDLRVLVDDYDAMDEGSQRTVQALAKAGASVLVAACAAPSWVTNHVELAPFTPEQSVALLEGVLGDVDAQRLEQIARVRVGCLPADLVNFALTAVEVRALVYRHGYWVLDESRLDSDRRHGARRFVMPASLSADSRRLGAAIAMLQPVPVRWALETAGVAPEALIPLQEAGWIRGRRLLSCATLRIADALIDAVEHPRDLWRSVVACLHEEEASPSALLGWALVGAEDAEGIERYGPATVEAALELDVRDAAKLATALVEQCPTADLLAARIRVGVLAGQVDEARTASLAWLGGREPQYADLPILMAMAQLEDSVTEDAHAILTWTDRARTVLGDRPVPAALDMLEARARFRSGDLQVAEDMCAARCESLPERREVSEWLHARGLLAQIRAQRLSPQEGLEVMDIPRDLGHGTRARSLFEGIRSRLLWMAGRPRQAAAGWQEVLVHRESLSTVDQARSENNAALCWYAAGDVERAVAGWQRSLLAFEALGADLEMLRVHVNLCQGFADLGRWDRAVEAGEHAVALARARDVPAYEAVAQGNLGDVAMWRKRFRQAEECYDRAEAMLAATDGPERVELARRRAELACSRMSTDAFEVADRAVLQSTQQAMEVERGRCLAVRAVLHARAGRRDEAYADAHDALDILRGKDATGDLAVARLWIADAMVALRDLDGARQHATEVLRYADEFARTPLRTWAHDVLAWARGRGDEGREQLEELTELSVRVARQLHLDGVLDELAEAALELIDAERAFVIRADGDELTVAARAGEGAAEATPSTSVVRRAIALGREIVATDLDNRMDLQQAESVVAMKLKAVMCAPLFLDGVAVGALYLDSRETPMASLSDAVSLVRSLAAHASVALGNARLTARVRSQVARAREVAHDLRNPLAGVLMMLEDVADGHESLTVGDARRAVGDLRHAMDLVHTSLTERSPDPVTFHWRSAIANWSRSLESQARLDGVQLVVNTDGGTGRVLGRPMDLRRAVANVLGNAIKYTPIGKTVTVTAFADDNRVGAWIDDEGPGVSEGDMERIFHSGVQADGALAGHGLGLAIARRVCREHGGDIVARQSPTGSRFELWVPRSG